MRRTVADIHVVLMEPDIIVTEPVFGQKILVEKTQIPLYRCKYFKNIFTII